MAQPAACSLKPVHEPGAEITTAVELIHNSHGILSQRTVGLAVGCVVVGDKVDPAVVDNLPEGRGSGATWTIDGRHKCSYEHFCRDKSILRCIRENSEH